MGLLKPNIRLGVPGVIHCFLSLSLALLLSSCGYSLQGRVKENFRPIQGIFVPVFSNNTDEVGAEVVFTNALIRELESRGGVVLTQRQPGARELKGVVTSISYYPTVSTDVGAKGLRTYRRLPTELMVEAAVAVSLVHPETKQVIWNGSFSSFRRIPMPLDRTYNFQAASSIGLITQSYIQSQYPLIARDVSRDIYDSILWEEEG